VGKTHSKFIGISSSDDIVRDTKFPIRCTVQFYKVTDMEDIPVEVFRDMNQNITRLYKLAVNSGSLVLEDSDRKTEWVKNEEETQAKDEKKLPILI